jgi:hypothetical protein
MTSSISPPSRRTFLKSSGLAVAATFAGASDIDAESLRATQAAHDTKESESPAQVAENKRGL